MTSDQLKNLQPNVSRYLDSAMADAIDAAQGSGWSVDGQIEFVRMRMDDAYMKARALQLESTA